VFLAFLSLVPMRFLPSFKLLGEAHSSLMFLLHPDFVFFFFVLLLGCVEVLSLSVRIIGFLHLSQTL